jgi:hypothetical protein
MAENTTSTSSNIIKQKLREYVRLQKMIVEKNKEIAQLRDQMNQINEEVMPYLKKKQLYNKTIKIDGYYVTLTQSRELDSLTYSFLQNCLQHYTGAKDQAVEITNFIKSQRKYDVHDRLKLELADSDDE